MQPRVKQLFSIGAMVATAMHVFACTYEPPLTNASAGGAGGGNQNGKEGDCLDGLDGDEDGLIDCADPDCDPGFECVSNAPAGFGEYTRIFIHSANEPTAPCPLETETPLVLGKSGALPACTSCECNVEVNCTDETVHLYSSMDCSGAPQTLTATTDCLALPTQGTPGSYDIMLEKPTGTCTVSTSVKTPESPWAEVVNACKAFQTTGKGCGGGQFCVPRSAAPYDAAICVQAPGDQMCTGEYGRKVVAFNDAQDNRSCTLCSCSAEFACNGYKVALDPASDCTSGMEKPSSLACTQLTGSEGAMHFSTPTSQVTKKDCTGGIPSGTVVPNNARTFCCTNE